MKNSPIIYLHLCLLITAVVLQACHCNSQPEQKLELKFLSGSEELRPEFYRVYGLGGKRDIYRNGTDNNYQLPLSMHHDSSTFVFEFETGQTDTLTITYTRQFVFIDKSCGQGTRYHDHDIGKSTTFSMATVNGNRREIKIYL